MSTYLYFVLQNIMNQTRIHKLNIYLFYTINLKLFKLDLQLDVTIANNLDELGLIL